MQEEWRSIENFPGYSVSSHGRVRKDETDKIMAMVRNQIGLLHVGLTRDNMQHRRAVSRLVAEAFVKEHITEAFDTPINLDGDRMNNRAWNLVWRPRWFAIRYVQQFEPLPRSLAQPLEDIRTGDVFETSWIATTTFGLLHRQLVIATLDFQEVWPTRQRFRLIY